MEMTLKLKTIAMLWRDIILNSDEIKTFCLEKYNKEPTIFVGVNGKKLPDKKYCPAIFILPGIKTEGADEDELSYGLCVSWSIDQSKVIVDGIEKIWEEKLEGNTIEFLGTYETDDFGQLIYDTLQKNLLNKGIFPISRNEYNVESQMYFPQFPGFMVLTTHIQPAFGEEINYQEEQK